MYNFTTEKASSFQQNIHMVVSKQLATLSGKDIIREDSLVEKWVKEWLGALRIFRLQREINTANK